MFPIMSFEVAIGITSGLYVAQVSFIPQKRWLEQHRPDDGFLSEEAADNPERLGKDRVWIIDPLDGTVS